MLTTVVEFTRYFAAVLFGMAVATSFAGMPSTRKNNMAMIFHAIIIFFI